MKYTVILTQISSTTVTVDAANVEDALETAYAVVPTQLDAVASGWGQDGNWSRELSDELVPEAVYDATTNERLWSDGEQWTRQPVPAAGGAS